MRKKLKIIRSYFYSKTFYHKIKSFLLSKISFILRKYYKVNAIKEKNNCLESNEKGYIFTAFGENFYKECINSVRILKKNTNCG